MAINEPQKLTTKITYRHVIQLSYCLHVYWCRYVPAAKLMGSSDDQIMYVF